MFGRGFESRRFHIFNFFSILPVHTGRIFIMTHHTQAPPTAYYNEQLLSVAGKTATVKKQADTIAWLRLVTILLLAGSVYLAFRESNNMLLLIPALLLAALFYILNKQSQLKEKATRLQLHGKLLNDELNALNGDYAAFYNGDAYINTTHTFSYDLDIFGNRSIYQVLNRTVTTNGADTLAGSLQNPYATQTEILNRQQANKELVAKPAFLHSFRVTGMRHAEEHDAAARIKQWLNLDDVFLGNKFFTVLLYIVPVFSVLFIVLSFMNETLHSGLIVMLAINWGINIRYTKKIKLSHYLVSESVKTIGKTEQLQYEVLREEFNSPLLAALKAQMASSVSAITQLKKLVHLFDNRQNGMVGPLLNSFFMFDVNCMTRLEKWRKQHKAQLESAMQLVGEMDKHCSYANYTFNHPDSVYPTVNEGSTVIYATDLKHPLIHKDTAVGNSFSIGEKEQLYMLTGANMTGKSTFIRTVGTNLIFAYVGLPVQASSFTMPLVRIYTSIRVTDSVQDDVSYFKAELQRMQLLMKEVSNSATPYLVLLDEPLRGTNSTDKQAGTKAIVEKLLHFNAIGIIATHDTGLCAMSEEHPGKISNFHFESEVFNGALRFDYILKPGGSTSNNATILMHMMGIVG